MSTNLIPNGDFTTDTSGWEAEAGVTMTRDTVIYHDSPASLKAVTNASAFQFVRVTPRLSLSVRQYIATGWVYASSGVTIRFGVFSDTLGTYEKDIVGNNGWQLATVVFVPVSAATDWTVFADTGPGGAATTFYLDTVALTTDYTILNGTESQLVNVNAGGTDVDALTYKDAVTLTGAEIVTLLANSGVAVTAESPTTQQKLVIKRMLGNRSA